MPSGAVGRRFTAILSVEWKGLLRRNCNSKRPLVFGHIVLMNMLGVRRSKEIWARITRHMDLRERDLHAGLVDDAEAEGADRDGRAANGVVDEDGAVASRYHEMIFSGKMRQAISQATGREGGWCRLQDDQCTKNGQSVAVVLREKHLDT